MATVRAIDIGYGGCKFVKHALDGQEPITAFFSSLVGVNPPPMSPDVAPRDTVVSEFDGVRYEAGVGAHLAIRHGEGRYESTGYCMTPQYKALVNGALFYTGQQTIDLLVLGLPNSTYLTDRQALRDSMLGSHRFTRFDQNHNEIERVVNVNEVLVVRQPIGGLVDAMTNEDQMFDGLSEGRSLIVDPGYYTLDWVVSDTTNPIEQRCGASNGAGASSIYRAIQASIQRQTGNDVDIARIEQAFEKGKDSVKVNGRIFELASFQREIESALHVAMVDMKARVQSFTDIDNIVLVGGAASLYAPMLKKITGRDDILVPNSPKFANVRGFQVMGEQWWARSFSANAA